MFPVISIVGWHNTGKTTLAEGLVRALKARALVVATIKHAHRAPSLDQPGTDTHRYAEAGSDVVGLVSHDLTTLAFATHSGEDLTQVLSRVPADVDIAIVEGYKRSTMPKVEVCLPGRPDPIVDAVELLGLAAREEDTDETVRALVNALEDRGFLETSGAVHNCFG